MGAGCCATALTAMQRPRWNAPRRAGRRSEAFRGRSRRAAELGRDALAMFVGNAPSPLAGNDGRFAAPGRARASAPPQLLRAPQPAVLAAPVSGSTVRLAATGI